LRDQSLPLEWIRDFVESVRPYLHVREEDSMLILLPNQAYKLNQSGIRILQQVLAGTDVEAIVNGSSDPSQARQDCYHFFVDLKALVSGNFGSGHGRRAVENVRYTAPFSQLPVLSEVALTYRCNLRCSFCYAGCNCTRGNSAEMSTDEVKKVLRVIREDADVPSVSFTGGEPTLRTDLPELIEHARSIGLRVNLISNGNRITAEYARTLEAAGLNSAQISIEGATAEAHDKLTQVPGSFEKTLAALKHLKSTSIYTQTNTTLNQDNLAEATGIVDLLARLGMERFAMNMLTPSGSATVNGHLAVSYTEIGDIIKSIHERARQRGIEFLWYSPTPYCLFNPIVEGLGNKSCAACDGLLSVDPLGNVLPCSSFETGVGNILREPFENVWQSAQARFWRHKEYAPDHCSGCDSLTACAAACPLYWEACGTAELTQAVAKQQEVADVVF